LICTAAILTRCNAVILSHSHPSGQLRPSDSDFQVTRKLKEALKLFDIVLHDHFIITPGSYYSFATNNNL